MLDNPVVAAFVVILAWLIGLGAKAVGLPLSTEILNALAAGIVMWVMAQFGLGLVQRRFAGLVKRGLLSAPKK